MSCYDLPSIEFAEGTLCMLEMKRLVNCVVIWTYQLDHLQSSLARQCSTIHAVLCSGSPRSLAVASEMLGCGQNHSIPWPFWVLGLKRCERSTEDNEYHPLDTRNLIHKEPILLRYSNTEINNSIAYHTLDFILIDISAHYWCILSTKRRAETI